MAGELRERVLRLLARREHSRAELLRKLAGAAADADELAKTLDDLASRGLLSDARYVEQRVSTRSRQIGNARLAQELRLSGVDSTLIAEALSGAGDEAERCRAVWQKKFAVLPTDRSEWLKQARFLQARGFSTATVRRILKDAADPDTMND